MELRTSLLIESWVLYAIGVAVVICRMISRRIKLGKWRNLMVDDYLMLLALVNFTGVVVSINEVAKNGSNYMSLEEAAALTPEGVQSAVYGSIMTFVLEIFTITGTWTVKACLLILYARLTRNALTKQHLLVKFAAGYCAITYFLAILMFIFYWCSPTPEYWAVPVRNSQCATYHRHMFFATAFNVSSDLLLLLIPVPIIIRTRLPIKRKIILVCILGLGIFNILAAILNRYYNFSNPNSYIFLYWYAAEVGVAMLVGNLPLCWPVIRAVFGSSQKTNTPSYHGYTISGEGRKRKHRANALSTTILRSTTWDKLDEQEAGGVVAERSCERPPPSDQGSQIELVLQGQALNQNHHHHAAVSTSPEEPDAVYQPGVVSSSSNGASLAGTAGDKIMVVTTVEVSSSDPHK
ncbi:hypothetical protein ED733_001455 [Metarhizium rileyi]|uniref:Rhodopsin domain-containing protein n=1 Tax=Metarhizium rileyi (strain RCEF 4871) TaxID=1649241 RepID=A0A5C6G9K5_METRR|nr:hypothetical protein ED733_001455 [Metarhizium rileyi]